MTQELKAHIKRDDSPVYGENVWHYTVDYLDPATGTVDRDTTSYDYGNVDSHEFAVACVDDAFKRYRSENK